MSPQLVGVLMVVGVLVIAFLSSGGGAVRSTPPNPWGMAPPRRFSGGAFAAWMFMGICTALLVYGIFRSPASIGEILKVLAQDLGG